MERLVFSVHENVSITSITRLLGLVILTRLCCDPVEISALEMAYVCFVWVSN